MFNTLDYAAYEGRYDGRNWFKLRRSVVNPAVTERIINLLHGAGYPFELADPTSEVQLPVIDAFMAEARWLGEDNIRLANVKRDECPTEKRPMRRAALDFVRRWYTQALHNACGGNGVPVGIHWVNELDYRY